MNEATLTALKDSIAAWERRAAGNFLVPNIQYCPLCTEFYRDNCRGCPVQEETGRWCCEDTPCEEYADAAYSLGRAATTDAEYAAIAAREVVFLKSLLPEGES